MSLPKSWNTCVLEDVANIVRGITFPASAKEFEKDNDNIACFRTSHIQSKLIWNDMYYVSKNYVKREEQLTQRHDILMSMANSENLVGKVVIKEDDDEAAFGAFLSVIRSKGIDIKFLFYQIKSDLVQKSLRANASQTVNIANISVRNLVKAPLVLAPLNEQKVIAKKLDELLVTVEIIKTRLDNASIIIKRFRQSILADATSGKLTEAWRSNNIKEQKIKIDKITQSWITIYKKDDKKYQLPKLSGDDTNYDDFPKTWNKTQLGYVFDVYVGATPSRKNKAFWNGNIPWVSSGEVAFNSINKTKEYITEDGLKNTSTNIHPVGTILLAMIGQGKTRGQPAILEIEACHNQNTAALRVNDKYSDSKYLYYYLWERYEKTREVGSGNNQKALNKKAVQSLPFPLPPLAEQKEIVSQVESLFTLADTLEEKIEAAKKRVDKLTKSILDKAFKGELVPQDPNDEPAAELLKRIKAEKENIKTKKAVKTKKKPTIQQVKINTIEDLSDFLVKEFPNKCFTIEDVIEKKKDDKQKLIKLIFQLISIKEFILKNKVYSIISSFKKGQQVIKIQEKVN